VSSLRVFCLYLTFGRALRSPASAHEITPCLRYSPYQILSPSEAADYCCIIRESILAWRELVLQNSKEIGTHRVKHFEAGAKQLSRLVRSYHHHFVGRCKWKSKTCSIHLLFLLLLILVYFIVITIRFSKRSSILDHEPPFCHFRGWPIGWEPVDTAR